MNTKIANIRKHRVPSVTVALASAALVLSGCAGAGSDEPGADPTSSDTALVAESQALLDNATAGLVYAGWLAGHESDAGAAEPTDFAPMTEWAGPTEPVEIGAGKRVVIISCAPGTACQDQAEVAERIMTEDLDWQAEIIQAAGTPQSFISSFETAISKSPDAVLVTAIADTAVAEQIAKARERGIITIASGVTPTGEEQYDAYLSGNTNMLFASNAFAVIADSDGAANAIVIRDTTFPNLAAGADHLIKILATCSGCDTHEVQWSAPQAQNPVEAQAIVTAALGSYPQATHIVMPYDSLGLSAVAAALDIAGRQDVRIVTKDASEAALQFTAQDIVAFDAGYDASWLAYAGVDQLVRALAGATLVTPEQQGIGIHLFTSETAPADGVVDFSSIIDFPTEYRSLWR